MKLVCKVFRKDTEMPACTFTQAAPHLSKAIVLASQDPDAVGFATLLEAVKTGRIQLVMIAGHRTGWTPRSLKSPLPAIIVISDDDDNIQSRNPDEWRCAISAIAWAKAVMIHGTAARGPEYGYAINAAERSGRVLIVETDSAHTAAWTAWVAPRRIPILTLFPEHGGTHPVASPARESAI